MNEDFAPYELAVKLKEKGFPQSPDWFNYSSYYEWDGLRKIHSLSNASVWFDPNISRDNIYFAPTISQVLKWLREERDVVVSVNPYYGKFVNVHWWWDIRTPVYKVEICNNIKQEGFDSYELAAIAGIEYVLDNLI